MKLLIFVLTAFFSEPSFPAAVKNVKAPPRKPSQAVAPIDQNAMNACLDNLRLEAWKARLSSAPAGDTKQESLANWSRAVAAEKMPTGCEQGTLEAFKDALRIQIAACKMAPDKAPTVAQIGCRTYTREEWCVEVNRRMLNLAESARDFATLMAQAKEDFDWVQNTGMQADTKDGRFKKGEVQFTAYYSPSFLKASAKPSAEFSVPIYRRPKDLVEILPGEARHCGDDKLTGNRLRFCRKNSDGSLSPFPDRRAIAEDRALAGQGLEIAYIADPLDVVILHLEGSGSLEVRQPRGAPKLVHLEYQGSNGRPNHFLSRILRCMGASKKDYGNIAAIRNYLAPRKEQLSTILSFDQNYVFFRDNDDGPYGVDHIKLTPMHSLATDLTILPTGAAMLFQTKNPTPTSASCPKISSLALAQDIGGAIKGAHVDWYTGEGEEAKRLAEQMNSPGAIFVALPKGAGKPVPGCVPAP
jgi:membrane-bound lytic murein transglycosylase